MISVSVTVPVYNTSQYLRQCLDALASQKMQNIEFILVDDGSTDDSGFICDEYASKDNRFKVIHQLNGGSASARQNGLEAAKGEYVIVCDSDDWPETDMYEKLYAKAIQSHADMVICGYFAEYPDGKSIRKQYWMTESEGVVDNDCMLRHGASSSWVKLVKRDLFTRSGASYEKNINLGEDELIIYKLLTANPKIVQISDHLYHYRRRYGEDTYTNNLNMSHIHQGYHIYRWMKENLENSVYEDMIIYKAICIACNCLRVPDVDKSFLRKFLKEELPFSSIFNKQIALNYNRFKPYVVASEKILPLPILVPMYKMLRHLFYK